MHLEIEYKLQTELQECTVWYAGYCGFFFVVKNLVWLVIWFGKTVQLPNQKPSNKSHILHMYFALFSFFLNIFVCMRYICLFDQKPMWKIGILTIRNFSAFTNTSNWIPFVSCVRKIPESNQTWIHRI